MYRVWVQFQSPGLHRWKAATNYLQYPHRHMFHFRVEVGITDLDREIEFIALKEELQQFVSLHILPHNSVVDMSCEMMAQRVLNHLRAGYGNRYYLISVSEDGENGATLEVLG